MSLLKKRGKMSEEQKAKIRVARYRWLYGPDWVQKRKEIEETKRLRAEEVAKEGHYRTPLVYATSPDFLGKKEMLLLLIRRMRDPQISVSNFIKLADIYTGMKGWVKPRQGFAKGTRKQKDMRTPSMSQIGGEVSEEVEDNEDSLNDLILQIEEKRKGDQNVG